DLVEAAEGQVPPGIVLDGEAVAWVDGRLSFDHLQQRMAASAPAARRLASQHPASYVAFDVLAVDGTDVRGLQWRDRRTLLDTLAAGFHPPIEVSPVTDDYDTAVSWFTDLPAATGIEGIVIKRQSSRYSPGERGWVKVKHRSHHDAVVGAVIGSVSRPEAVIAGRYTADGRLRIVGRSGPLSAQHVDELARALTPVSAQEHPWPTEISSGHFGGGKVTITHVAPTVVVEVSADAATQGGRHRHALRLIRLRLDMTAADITVD
ncbi:MAG: ATP-dependent DNA ligase, partial [Microlunatus sp.]|nr:ATP-dependent DNA ligase [Microlunatus sp.]